MENAESALKTKLKQLEKAEEKTNQVLKGGKQTTIQRQLMTLKELVTEADNARRVVEALKIEAKVSDVEVSEWNDVISAKIEEADSHIETLEEWLANRKMEAENQEREENAVRNKTSQDEAETDLQAKAGNQTSVGEAKLPKLVITKFNGTYADWPRFWD